MRGTTVTPRMMMMSKRLEKRVWLFGKKCFYCFLYDKCVGGGDSAGDIIGLVQCLTCHEKSFLVDWQMSLYLHLYITSNIRIPTTTLLLYFPGIKYIISILLPAVNCLLGVI